MMMTEFGALDNGTRAIEELHYLTSEADRFALSWALCAAASRPSFRSLARTVSDGQLFLVFCSWQFKWFGDFTTAVRPAPLESFYTPEGQLETNKVRALTGTYPSAVAGKLHTTYFDHATAKFECSFEMSLVSLLSSPLSFVEDTHCLSPIPLSSAEAQTAHCRSC